MLTIYDRLPRLFRPRFTLFLAALTAASAANAQSLGYDTTIFAADSFAAGTMAAADSVPDEHSVNGGMMSVEADDDNSISPDGPDLAPPPPAAALEDMASPTASGRGYGALRMGGKLRLTNGVASLDGASGGGLAGWAVIAGRETVEGIGASAHLTYAELPDYNWQSHGVAIGLFNRLELSYARQNLDTIDVGSALGLGRSYVLNQDIFGAKLRLFGDAVYGSPYLPQVAVGVQYKKNLDGAVTRFVGASSDHGTDFYVAATKIFLAQSLLANGTLRYTKANQLGLLGFGGDTSDKRSVQLEGSLAYMLSRNLVVGAEYRTKPDNLSIVREDDWLDLFAAWSIGDHLTLTAAYVDLGTIAIAEQQRGGLLSLQAAF